MEAFNLKAYARAGAAVRLLEIEKERAAILATFPDLGRANRRSGGAAVKQAAASAPRKRRRMSKEARRRISEAQKKRWAAQKAGK